jgi:hypothetical protein
MSRRPSGFARRSFIVSNFVEVPKAIRELLISGALQDCIQIDIE